VKVGKHRVRVRGIPVDVRSVSDARRSTDEKFERKV
jgi:hypothetical protein